MMGNARPCKAARGLRILLMSAISAARSFSKPKIFCIGCNKTVTTSLQRASNEFGLAVGEQWDTSLMRFYMAMFGDGSPPHVEHLKAVCHNRPGDVYEANRLLDNTPADNPLNKDALLSRYNNHNEAVREYFSHRHGDSLVLNVAEPGACYKLYDFLGRLRTGRNFPWENKTSNHSDASSRLIPVGPVTEDTQ